MPFAIDGSTQLEDCGIFGLRLDVDGRPETEPLCGKVSGIDEVGVRAWIGRVHSVARARNVHPWFTPTPRFCRQIGRGSNVQAVRVTSMVVHIVDERRIAPRAERVQVAHREQPIVVLERNPRTRRIRQPIEIALQSIDRRGLAVGHSANMQRQRISTDEYGPCRLRIELANRRANDFLARRVEHDELVRMEAESNVKPPCEIARRRERSPDDARIVERIERVAADWMCGKREDLATDAEGADSQLVASRDGVSQRDGVRTNDFTQVNSTSLQSERRDVPMRCLTKVNAVVGELAAQSPADGHALFTCLG